jgi:hypothetical protein
MDFVKKNYRLTRNHTGSRLGGVLDVVLPKWSGRRV